MRTVQASQISGKCTGKDRDHVHTLSYATLSLCGFASCRLGGRDCSGIQEASTLTLSMGEDRSCEVHTRAPHYVAMVVRSKGSSLCTVKISLLLESLVSILTYFNFKKRFVLKCFI